jgi:hypothetical protein
MLDPVVQSAFVVIVAWLLKLLAGALGFPLDEQTLYTLAAAIVAYLLSKLGLGLTRKAFPGAVKRGLLSESDR